MPEKLDYRNPPIVPMGLNKVAFDLVVAITQRGLFAHVNEETNNEEIKAVVNYAQPRKLSCVIL